MQPNRRLIIVQYQYKCHMQHWNGYVSVGNLYTTEQVVSTPFAHSGHMHVCLWSMGHTSTIQTSTLLTTQWLKGMAVSIPSHAQAKSLVHSWCVLPYVNF